MKRRAFLGLLAMSGLSLGTSFMGNCKADAANDEITKEKITVSDSKVKISSAEFELKNGSSEMKSNCWCYGYYYYYTPYVYYYVPRVYTVRYCYRYHYVCYFNGDDSSNKVRGLMISEAPASNSPLAKLGVKKGDLITKINGAAISSEEDIKKIGENSTLTVVKANPSSSEDIERFICN